MKMGCVIVGVATVVGLGVQTSERAKHEGRVKEREPARRGKLAVPEVMDGRVIGQAISQVPPSLCILLCPDRLFLGFPCIL
jgi:hypothetical protein